MVYGVVVGSLSWRQNVKCPISKISPNLDCDLVTISFITVFAYDIDLRGRPLIILGRGAKGIFLMNFSLGTSSV